MGVNVSIKCKHKVGILSLWEDDYQVVSFDELVKEIAYRYDVAEGILERENCTERNKKIVEAKGFNFLEKKHLYRFKFCPDCAKPVEWDLLELVAKDNIKKRIIYLQGK